MNSAALPENMKISVIVPVFNEEQSIRQLLEGLLTQSCPADEIVITDGGSSDATPEIITQYAADHPQVRLVRDGRALPGRGRNLAVAQASGEWLAFIDAGVVPAQDWLAQLVDCVKRDPNTDVVFGAWEPVTDTFFKECAAIAYAYVPNRENIEEVKRSRALFSSLMRRRVWHDVGGFAEHLRSAEDLLFFNKIDEKPFQVRYSPAALVSWSMQPTFSLTFARFVVYSRNNLSAGLGKEWQTVILSRYVALVLVAVGLVLVTRWWAILTLALLLLMFVARALVALVRNRHTYPAGLGRNLKRVLVLVPLLMTIDVATITGMFAWLFREKLHLLRR
jgi:glycosyltransferase involved in cell wall biosynthesis